MTLVILMCAGQSKRWDLPTPKHIAEVCGLPNICRTYDLLRTQDVHIKVIVNEQNIQFFPSHLPLQIGSAEREIDRFRNGLGLMQGYDKTIFLYGDVVYTKDDLQFILSGQDYAFYGRQGKNALTKKNFGEILGVVVTDFARFLHDVQEVASRNQQKERGWEVFGNSPFNKFIPISDFTDDYDTQSEYQNILSLIAANPEKYRV